MARILIAWNQTDEDVTTWWRRDGRRTPDWDSAKVVDPGDTVEEEMALIESALVDVGHDVTVVNIRDSLDVLLDAVERIRPDAVLNLVEWFHDDIAHEYHLASVFELLGVPYSGARPLALALCQNKPHAKALLAAAGVPTPKWRVVENVAAIGELGLSFPVIVKPAFEDASGGIDAGSVVGDRAALDARVAHVVKEHRMPALVEEFIAGREIHCAVIGNAPMQSLPLFEMEFKDAVGDDGRTLPRIITYRAKWDPFSRDYYAVESRCPAEVDDAVAARVQEIALRACRVLGTRDYARVDLRLDPVTNQPYVLEVNPNPDLANGCAFAQCVRASGRTYANALVEIAEMALERGKAAARPPAPSDALLHEYLARRGAK
jgi:D-alanine-D-alanine ligase